jgi:pantetheine-phosphate adenylyltransferase
MGHLDIVRRASALFERVVVAVVENPSKEPLFPTGERVEMLEEALGGVENAEVDSFSGLLVDYAARKGITVQEGERWLAPNLGYTPQPQPALS